MNKNRIKNLKTILYPMMLLAVFIFPAAAQTISIASQTVTPGSSVTVPIVASSITNLGAYTISLNYNQSVVVVDSVGAGALGGVTTNINNAAGVTQMSAFSVTPVSGTVILANVVLRAVGTGGQTGPLNLTVSTLSDPDGNNIPNTVINGTFAILGTLPIPPPAGYISGMILDPNTNPQPNIYVIAQNGTDTFFGYSNPNGIYVITIPGGKVNAYYQVSVTLQNGTTGGGVQTLLVTSGNTTVAQNIVLVPSAYPESKIDVASLTSIPADGMSTTTITATITGKLSNGTIVPLRNGVVNGNTTALVNFYLKNGSLDVTTGNNGTFSGGVLKVLNVPIDNNGQAKVVLNAGFNPGSIQVFNNVTVKRLNNTEVNSSIMISFTPLQGHVTGTVRSSENVPLAGVQVAVFRLNVTSHLFEPVMVSGQQKSTITAVDGSYTLSFIPVIIDVNHNVPSLLIGESGNTILLQSSLAGSGYNNGSLITWISSAGRTAEGNDIVMTSGQPDQIYVSVDNSVDQVLDTPAKLANGISTWIVTAQLMKSGHNAGIAGQSITFTIDNPSVATLSSTTALTDITGKATVTLTSTVNPGTVKVTGSSVTRDNVLLTDYDFAKSSGVAQLSGIVTNENQLQLPGATVSLSKDVFGNGTTFVPALDINGNLIPSQITPNVGQTTYTFIAVPSGTYKVTASLGNQSGFAYPVNLTSGTSTANVVIVGGVVPPGRIAGIVTNAQGGAAISGADIFLDGADTTINTNATGGYIITNVAPGSHVVMAVASGYTNGNATANVLSGATATANIALTSTSVPVWQNYWSCGATAAARKAGVTNAVNDYLFSHILSKTDITAIVNEYLFPSC